MSECAPARAKPHLTLGTLGHAGHGKTTLTAALVRVRADAPGAPGVPQAPPGVQLHVPPAAPGGATARRSYETGTRRYTHLDLPGQAGRAGAVIAGAAQLDGAVLVVSVLDGVQAQTREHVLLAQQMGVEHLVVALSKAEAGGDELTELVELDVRALLTAHGYAGATLPVVRVSGARALAGDARWRDGSRARFHFRAAEVGGVTRFGSGHAAPPGATVSARVLLDAAVPLEEGLRFAVRAGGGTVALGTVTRCRTADGPHGADGTADGDGGD